MQTTKTILDRLLLMLAGDLGYTMSDEELSLYTEHLGSFGLKPVRLAILDILAEKRPRGTFPPISEFRRHLDVARSQSA
jgi:DNA-binding MarR family transcriptional regulator